MGAGSPSGDPLNSKPGTLQVRDQGTLFYSRTVLSVDSAETETKRSDFSAITIGRLGLGLSVITCATPSAIA